MKDNKYIYNMKQKEEKHGIAKERKQAISQTYLIKSFGQNITKLKETELITEEEYLNLRKVHETVISTYINSHKL